jgi:type I restriction enzyme S subunit
MFRAYDQLKVFYNMGSGVRQGINYDVLKRIPLICPSLFEQRHIADYLDERCAAIDEVRRTIEDEVEALRRLRKATIHRAVTKGIDEGVPMRDSGVEWIGEIPSTWRIMRIKNLCALKTGHTPPSTRQDYFDGDFDWYTPVDIQNDRLLDSTRKVSMSAVYERQVPLYPKNSVLLVAIGDTGRVGLSQHVCSSNQQITALIPTDCYPVWLFYVLQNERDNVNGLALSTMLPILNNTYISGYKIAVPPLSEQQRIADYLDERCAAIDSVIDTRTRQLERLDDYRRALIFAYVTGKKEVPTDE